MIPTSLIFEFTCLLFAIIFLRNRTGDDWRAFIPFLTFVVIVEGIGWYSGAVLKVKNHWIYNIYLPVGFYFLTWRFKEIFSVEPRAKAVLLIVVLAFTLVFTVESIQTNFIDYNRQSSLVSSVFLVVFCGIYYYLLLSQAKHENLSGSPEFWFVSGVFVFYFSTTAVSVFFTELMAINLENGIPLRYIIFSVLNAIMYGCWAYAFICRSRQTILYPK